MTTVFRWLLMVALAASLRAGDDLKPLSLNDLFRRYQQGGERRSRQQGAILAEIIRREGSFEFLAEHLRRKPNAIPSQELKEARLKAVHLVTSHTARAKDFIPLLLDCLEDEDDIRGAVATALGSLGPAAKEAVPVLIEELHFRNERAPYALMQIAPESDVVINALIDLAEGTSVNGNLKAAAINAFMMKKPKSERLDKVLKEIVETSESYLANQARALLGLPMKEDAAAGFGGPTAYPGQFTEKDIPMLLARLKENPNSYPTARALSFLGPTAAEQAAPILLQALEDTPENMRFAAVSRLGDLGAVARPVIPLLLRMIEGDEIFAAQNALSVLGRIGPGALEAKPTVIRCLDDPHAMIRFNAGLALLEIDPTAAEQAMPALLEAADRDGASDFEINVVGKLGPRAAAILPRLTRLMEPASPSRAGAAGAIARIDPSRSTEMWKALREELNHDGRDRKVRAIYAAGQLGAAGAPALEPLRKIATDKDELISSLAKTSIWQIENDHWR